jgi:hypothetical protein
MSRPVWIALAVLVAAGLLGAFVLWQILEPEKTETSFAPRGAKVLAQRILPPSAEIPVQHVITWRLGGQPEDPASGFYGVTISQQGRELYGHRARAGTLGVHVETGDFTGDGHADVLVFEDTGGSGGCGVYRALTTSDAEVRQIQARLLCIDRGTIHLRDEGVLLRLGVRRKPRPPGGQIHCCYLFLRTTLKRWNGRRLVQVRTSMRRLRGRHAWPPGGWPPGRRA